MALPPIGTLMRRSNGYSLLDMLVTLVIAGVLAGIAWPGFGNLILELRMTATINAFIHGVHLAKSTARMTQRETVLCKSGDGQQCRHDGDWQDGWLVFANHDEDYPPAIDPTDRVIEVNAAWRFGEVSANRKSFIFRPFAKRATNGTLIFCDRRGPEYARAVIISYTGRPRVQSAAKLGKSFTCAS